MQLSCNNEMYKMNIVNIATYMRSKAVRKILDSGGEVDLFLYISGLSIAWSMPKEQVMRDYLLTFGKMKEEEA